MGLFDKLFGTKSIDESKYDILLSATKVGLAFLSGSDGGSLSLMKNRNSIQYILLCRSIFFVYQDELGIGVETLLKTCGGSCPPSLWKTFTNSVIIKKLSKRTDGEELDIRTSLSIEKNTAELYLNQLCQQLKSIYPGVKINNDGYGIRIIVTGDNRANFTYR